MNSKTNISKEMIAKRFGEKMEKNKDTRQYTSDQRGLMYRKKGRNTRDGEYTQKWSVI